MVDVDLKIVFTTSEREKWLMNIIQYRNRVESRDDISTAMVVLSKDISLPRFEPYHIVTLSCLIDVIKKKGAAVYLTVENPSLKSFIWDDVHIRDYWNGNTIPLYSTAESKNFDLWRIDNQYIQNYSISLFNYFHRVHFNGMDLGGLSNGLIELHQNVVDHAQADGTAFSYITYDEPTGKICIAVCDFGVGIPYTLRNVYPDEKTALKQSLKDGVSAKTNSHNFGMGLSDVESLVTKTDTLRIVSNHSMLFEEGKQIKTYSLNYHFGGTLIYLTIDINSFESDELIGDFEL